MAISTTDPRTGEVLRTFDELTDEQVEDRLVRGLLPLLQPTDSPITPNVPAGSGQPPISSTSAPTSSPR